MQTIKSVTDTQTALMERMKLTAVSAGKVFDNTNEHYSTLRCTALHYNALHYTTLHYNTSQHTTRRNTTAHHTTAYHRNTTPQHITSFHRNTTPQHIIPQKHHTKHITAYRPQKHHSIPQKHHSTSQHTTPHYSTANLATGTPQYSATHYAYYHTLRFIYSNLNTDGHFKLKKLNADPKQFIFFVRI